MKLRYLTPGRAAYYVAIAMIAFVVIMLAKAMLGDGGASAVVLVMMGLLLIVDIKAVPPSISLIRPFLPGIGWIDLAVATCVYVGLGLYAYYASQVTDQREGMISIVIILGVFFVIGVAGLFRWQRWRVKR
jgi:hypothetical protein